MSQDNTATPSGRILIVDDDMTLRELMKDALVRDDYIIEEVDNGLDALAAVRNSEPDMILLGVKMPGMNGFEVCSEIRTNLNMQGISVVMVTGLEDSESIEKAFSLGATAFINKPINSITFRYQIQYLLKARNAFVELKEREIHLEYMERISRILAQSKNRDAILQEALDEMLDIFSADRVFIISSLDADSSEPEASYEALSTGHTSIRGKES
ncbi:MAG: response regulator, partial [Gammaproteobacteria bacterium]|nr:response regulator [Gammaproteobacteria bacterium]